MQRSVSAVPSRATATPIAIPSAPSRPLPFTSSSSFIHPDAIQATISEVMSSRQAEEALKNFFESALTPDEEEGQKEETENNNDGIIEGLKVTLMKHQIEGLAFLQEHESEGDRLKGKGKAKYGGILGDDVHSPSIN
jgi:SNF2 family DNA or RNA helicase